MEAAMIAGEKASQGEAFPAALSKPYRVYRSCGNGQPYEGVADYDTIDGVLNHHFHRDAQYKIRVTGDLYLSPKEFVEWAKAQVRRFTACTE
jgi:hypothetical protein